MKNGIFIPDDIKPYPSEYEISAAMIVSQYFNSGVTFVKRLQNSKTADFKILDTTWEVAIR